MSRLEDKREGVGTEGPHRNDEGERRRGPEGSLFLLGIAAAGTLSGQGAFLLSPAFLAAGPKTIALAGGWAGLLLGFLAGGTRSGGGRADPILAAGAVLISGAVMGAAGVFLAEPSRLLEWLCAPAAAGLKVSPVFPWLLFTLAALIPFLLGAAVRLRLAEAVYLGRGRSGRLLLLLGGALGALLSPYLLYHTLGFHSFMQLIAFLALLCGFLCLGTAKGGDRDRVKTREEPLIPPSHAVNLETFLFGLGTGLFFSYLHARLEVPLSTGQPPGGILAGFTLAGLVLGLVLLTACPWLMHFSGSYLLLAAAALAPWVKVLPPTSHGETLRQAALCCMPFGAALGLSTQGRFQEYIGRGALGLSMGLASAFLLAPRVWWTPVEPSGILMLGAAPFLLLGLLSGGKGGDGDRDRAAPVKIAAGLICLCLSLSTNKAFWFPPEEPDGILIRDGQQTVTCRPGKPDAPPHIEVQCSPFYQGEGPEQHKRMAMISVLQHPDPKSVLLLGPDTGLTLKEILLDPMVRNITWVHSHSAFFQLARHLYGERWTSADGATLPITIQAPVRLYVRRTTARYDLILLPPFPMEGDLPHILLTRQFYREARDRLEDNGLFCQWIFPHTLRQETFARLLATVNEVFPKLRVFIDHRRTLQPALALVGTVGHEVLSARHTRNRLQIANRLEAFQKIGLDPAWFAILFVTHGEVLDARVPPQHFSDGEVEIPFSWPEEQKANLLANLRFLSGLQTPPYPWFWVEGKSRPKPPVLPLYVNEVFRLGTLMERATLKQIEKLGPVPRPDLATGAEMDLTEALALARGLAFLPEDPYLLGLLVDKTRALMKEQRSQEGMALLAACVEAAPFAASIRLELARILHNQKAYGQGIVLLEGAPRMDWRIFSALAVFRARLGEEALARLMLTEAALRVSRWGEEYPWIQAIWEIVEGRFPLPDDHLDLRRIRDIPDIVKDFVFEHMEMGKKQGR